jgi:hypothetical protein
MPPVAEARLASREGAGPVPYVAHGNEIIDEAANHLRWVFGPDQETA